MRGSGRTLTRTRAAAITCGALLAAGGATAYAHESDGHPTDTLGHSTLEQRIFGEDQRRLSDPDNDEVFDFLELRGGEPHVVREALTDARPGRANRRRSLIYLAQLTDFQLSDEESPSRVDFLDDEFGRGGVTAAHRPQEALVAHQVEWTIRQVNQFLRSPVPQGNGVAARMTNSVLTGDLADNQQLNETEWVVQLLEGGTIEPNSGSSDPESEEDYDGLGCSQADHEQLAEEAPNYTGIQDYDDYPPLLGRNPNFYDPDEPFGDYELWPEYSGLLDRAQESFEVEGLEVPSYVAFGNHDSLAQGNEDAIRPFEDIGTGCVKFFPSTGDDPGGLGTNPDEFAQRIVDLIEGGALPAGANYVPPDEDRQYVDAVQFKQVHDTGRQTDEHGFSFIDQEELDASEGAASYYSFVPNTRTREIRYIVLDTVAEGGVVEESSNGNIDDPQWQWLRNELRRAQRRDELIVVFGHHATDSLTADVADELVPSRPGPLPGAPPCEEEDEHGHGVNPGCDLDPRDSLPLRFGDDLASLFLRFPNVIAYVAGHSHNNRVQPIEGEDGGGFWEIKSPAIVDWPPQHRLIEVMNNRDGTLSIFGTLLDHGSPAESPRSAPAPDDQVAAASAELFGSDILASIGRTISFNDQQVGPGGPEGQPNDRNVELLLRDPRQRDDDPGDGDDPGDDGDDPGDGDGPGGGGDGGGGGGFVSGGGDGLRGGDRDHDFSGATASLGGGDLPFTGLALGTLALVAAGLVTAGAALRRRAAR